MTTGGDREGQSLDLRCLFSAHRFHRLGDLSKSGGINQKRRVVPMTNQQAFFLISGIIFGLVALFHVLRLAFRWQVRLRSQEIPMWLSGVGFVAAAGMCFWAFWLIL